MPVHLKSLLLALIKDLMPFFLTYRFDFDVDVDMNENLVQEKISGSTMSEICSGRTMSVKWFREYNVRKY